MQSTGLANGVPDTAPGHPYRTPFTGLPPTSLQPLRLAGTDNELILSEPLFQLLPVVGPPPPIQLVHHDFTDDDFIPLDGAVALFPGALRRRPHIRGGATVTLSQLFPNPNELILRHSAPGIVIERQQQLNEEHEKGPALRVPDRFPIVRKIHPAYGPVASIYRDVSTIRGVKLPKAND
jgi:hypothetical protein